MIGRANNQSTPGAHNDMVRNESPDCQETSSKLPETQRYSIEIILNTEEQQNVLQHMAFNFNDTLITLN